MQPARGQVSFYYPGKAFPAISVTGRSCALLCDHCRGHYLEGMTAVRSPDKLVELAAQLKRDGATGFLLSGGCDSRGRIPLLQYVDAVRSIRESTGLRCNLHTGLLDGDEAAALVRSGADCYSMDLVQDEGVIRGTLHLQAAPSDYVRTLEALFSAGARRVVPHICVGLAPSEVSEERCVDLASGFPIGGLVLLGFRPTRGTPLQSRPPPSRERILHALEYAIQRTEAPVLVGCMRMRGDWELERACIEAGAAGIASPSRRTVEWAVENGYRTESKQECCALHL